MSHLQIQLCRRRAGKAGRQTLHVRQVGTRRKLCPRKARGGRRRRPGRRRRRRRQRRVCLGGAGRRVLLLLRGGAQEGEQVRRAQVLHHLPGGLSDSPSVAFSPSLVLAGDSPSPTPFSPSQAFQSLKICFQTAQSQSPTQAFFWPRFLSQEFQVDQHGLNSLF